MKDKQYMQQYDIVFVRQNEEVRKNHLGWDRCEKQDHVPALPFSSVPHCAAAAFVLLVAVLVFRQLIPELEATSLHSQYPKHKTHTVVLLVAMVLARFVISQSQH